jgi:pimeloyl-ACP methyl ester carboxylesterase
VHKRPLAPLELLQHCATEALEGNPESGFRLRVDPKFFTPANHPRNDTRLGWEMYSRIACPALLVRGAVSAVLPRAVAIRLAAAIPDCRLHEIRGSGHTPMLENPAAFREQVCSFLGQVRERV